jgi:membrane-bound inhibitor of C-type lysozyme
MAALAGCSQPAAAPTAAAPEAAPAAAPADPGAADAPLAADWRTYDCADGRTIQAQYPDRDTAVLKLGDAEIRMTIAVSASGARYVGEGRQWWTKGEAGTLAPLRPGEDIASEAGVACKAGPLSAG